MPCNIRVEESTHLTELVLECDGLRIECADTALISIESDKLPNCTFWYGEGRCSAELEALIVEKFGEESDDVEEACDADLVITYSDGNVEYVEKARTTETTAAHIGYILGRYATVHNVPPDYMFDLLRMMHSKAEAEAAAPRPVKSAPYHSAQRPCLSMRLE